MSLKNKILKNIGANAYGQFVTILVQLASVPLFLKYWSVDLYGEWLILSAIPAYLNLSDIGFATVAANDMTMRVANGDKQGALNVYQSIWVFISAISAIVAVVFYGAIYFLPLNDLFGIRHISDIDVQRVLMVLMLYAFVGLQGGVLSAGYRAVGKFALGTIINNTIRLTEWAASFVAILFNGNVVFIAIVMLCTRCIGTLVMWLVLQQQNKWLILGCSNASRQKIAELFRPALAFMVFPLGLALSIQGMVIIVGLLLGSGAVVIFSAYRTASRFLVQLITMINQSIWPEISAAFGAGNIKLVSMLHRKGTYIAFWVAFISLLFFSIFGEKVIGIWTHNAFKQNDILFTCFVVASFLNVLWQTSWVVLMATNKHQRISIIFIISSISALLLSALIVPILGINGAGIVLVCSELPLLYYVIHSTLTLLGEQWSDYIKIVVPAVITENHKERLKGIGIIYLWINRERPKMFSRRWLKVWAKRLLNMSGLIRILLNRTRYQFKGVRLGKLTILGKLDFNGSAKRLQIGESSFIGSNVHFALHDNIIIGNYVCINNNVHLLTGSHDTASSKWLMFTKPIEIKDHVWVAYNAIILPGVVIGRGAVVGAGAVVTKDVEDYSVVAGNPARVVSKRNNSLTYSPVQFCAPYEAWIGAETKL